MPQQYVVHFYVSDRVYRAFNKDEIETAARIAFYQSVPEWADIVTIASRLNIQWSGYLLSNEQSWLIRVSGEVS